MPDWFVRNVADAEWWVNDKFGARTFLVPGGSQVGARVHVLEPGKPSTLYHRESDQEGFLVVEGECVLVVEGEEHPLRRWDYFHCPPGTTHSFVGAGDGPCVMVTLGARSEAGTILYARDEAALGRGAGVEEETDTPSEAYAPFPKWEPGRPPAWGALPWNDPPSY
ncbi:MAG TPA: cupin domain-containing protein [Gaiellaceae bacterium]|nr:cupin domain-containing protein [Gaiellaceae bacterium]